MENLDFGQYPFQSIKFMNLVVPSPCETKPYTKREYKRIQGNTREYWGIQENTGKYRGIKENIIEYRGTLENTG